ncbi:MAG: hypothetical protein H6600_09100 [Flavobacteriales bacterium]|nr:hypothetical protein [Flavobacteriales bacterium]
MKQLPKASKPPFYKTGWFITTVASVAGIAVITTNFILNDDTSTLNPNQASSLNTETPPPSKSVAISQTNLIEEESSNIDVLLVHESESIENEDQENPSKNNQYSNAQLEQYIEMYTAEMMAAKTTYENAVETRVNFEKNAPDKPVSKGNPDRQFVLDVNPKDFPELAQYSDLLFEVEANDPNFSPSVYEEEWEDIRLKSNKAGKTYYLSLFRGNYSKTFSVFPIFNGSNFDIANQEYLIKLEKHKEELEILKQNEDALKIEYDKAAHKLDELKTQENNLSKTN